MEEPHQLLNTLIAALIGTIVGGILERHGTGPKPAAPEQPVPELPAVLAEAEDDAELDEVRGEDAEEEELGEQPGGGRGGAGRHEEEKRGAGAVQAQGERLLALPGGGGGHDADVHSLRKPTERVK